MLELYYAPDNVSLVLRLALEEAGAPFKTILVDRASCAQKTQSYLALNPAGLIPTLVTPQGVLTETGACLLWLTDIYPNAGLGPSVKNPSRGIFLRWLFYLANTVHVDLGQVFYPNQFAPEDASDAFYAITTNRVSGHLEILNSVVRAEPSLFEPPSALALYIGPMLRWAALYPTTHKRWLDLRAFPELKKLTKDLEGRGSVKTAIIEEGLAEILLSDPMLPNSLEGTAT